MKKINLDFMNFMITVRNDELLCTVNSQSGSEDDVHAKHQSMIHNDKWMLEQFSIFFRTFFDDVMVDFERVQSRLA